VPGDHESWYAMQPPYTNGAALSEKVDPYMTTYKYTALGEQAAKAIADVAPYLMGVKRGRKSCL
jgi:hypothetical protein